MSARKKPRIIAMMMLYNEQRWIQKLLDSIPDFCNGIVIYDNGSTDKTTEICKNHNKVVDFCRMEKNEYPNSANYVKINNILLNMARNQKPDYILNLCGDEIFQPNAKDILLEEINVIYPSASVFEFEHLTIWDKPNQYRYDGVYSNTWYPTLLKMENQPEDLSFVDYVKNQGVSHVLKIPINSVGLGNSVRSRVKIFHYGYYDKELRMEKYNEYIRRDKDKEKWDNYIHLITGKGKFSGPHGMEFRTLPEGTYYKDIT